MIAHHNLPIADVLQVVGDVVHHLLGEVFELRGLHFGLLWKIKIKNVI